MKPWQGWVPRHPRALGGLFALYWLAMFLATHIPMPPVESVPNNTDKLVHLVMYAGFAFLFALWLSARQAHPTHLIWKVLGASILYGMLDELLQIPIESRSADIWDFVMDQIGAVIGWGCFRFSRLKANWLWEPHPPST